MTKVHACLIAAFGGIALMITSALAQPPQPTSLPQFLRQDEVDAETKWRSDNLDAMARQTGTEELVRQYHANDSGRVGPKMDCLRKESLRGNAEAIGACGVPRNLYPSAINFVAGLNVHGELVSMAFLRKFCQNSLEVGVSFSCTYGGVTMNFGR
jgi:cytochrome oxidase assembly protein ShyY1